MSTDGNTHVHVGSRKNRLVGLAYVVVTIVLLAVVTEGTAVAKAPIDEYVVTPSTTQAGGHPDVRMRIKVGNIITQKFVNPCFCNDPKDIFIGLPAGVIGNPHALPRCTDLEFATTHCPVASQIGVIGIRVGSDLENQHYAQPIFNMVPHPNQSGLSAFKDPLGAPQYVVLSARTNSDYGLDAGVLGIEHLVPVRALTQIFWGVPADPKHDALRFPPGVPGINCGFDDPGPYLEADLFPSNCEIAQTFPPRPSNSLPQPFLSNPTACSGTLFASLESVAYDDEADFAESAFPAITGCDQLSFNPSLAAKPTTTATDSPSGVDVNLKVPQFLSAGAPSPSQIRGSTVTLPEGFSFNPGAADGKTSCSDAEANFGTKEAAQCPEFAKVGTLTLDSSALPAPIPGYIYLGTPKPGERYRLIFAADGFATHIKLAGSVDPDPVTGQLTVSFHNLPQSPLTRFNQHFFGSERGLLTTPTHCGTYAVHSTFVPWDSVLPDQRVTQFFTLDSGPGGSSCPGSVRPFRPEFSAASTRNTAGSHSPFGIELTRNDGDQTLSGLRIQTPPGFAASLRGIPYCPEPVIARLAAGEYSGLAEQVASACPALSQVGTAVAGAGAGTRPLYVAGKVYLSGPYKGAPLSLVVVIPAVSGPYDLGNVVVRAAIEVDPVTAQVTTTSDSLPQIVAGVPLRTRSIRVDLDRPDFALNPTNCDQLSVNAVIDGAEGSRVERSSPFQVANCAVLPYKPRVSLTLTGGVRRRGHPAIHAVLTAAPGEANSRRVSVTLPKGELLDQAHLDTVCTQVNFAKGSCPAGSVVGRVTASSPLLDEPLRGSVYLRSSTHNLPDLVLDLHGQIDVEAAARIDSVAGRLRTTFPAIPDVPLARVEVDLTGGSKGLLQNSDTLCGVEKRFTLRMRAQSNASSQGRPTLKVACNRGTKRTNDVHKGRR